MVAISNIIFFRKLLHKIDHGRHIKCKKNFNQWLTLNLGKGMKQ